jgi:hypothetical protein
MLLFKKKIKKISVLLLVLIILGGLFSFEKNTRAQTEGDLQRVFLTRTSCDLNPNPGGKWSWSFSIKTTNLVDGEKIRILVFEEETGTFPLEERKPIKNNTSSFRTGYILNTNTKYKISVFTGEGSKILAIYSGVTAKSGDKNCAPETKQDETDRSKPTPAFLLLQEKRSEAGSKVDTDTNYTLLEKLPDGSGGYFTSFESNPTKNSCPFGKYLNILIKLAIGICSVLAVLMIVKGGIQYMMGELPSEKSSGRSTITNAILGLIVALGAYLILYTVNPNLLNFCLDQQLPITEITLNEEIPTAESFSVNETVPTGRTGSCLEGIISIETSGGVIVLCSKIATNVKNAIEKAWSEGYKISGWGWRSNQKQIELRRKNGCPDIYNSPPSKCKVPTAIPGTSMHESGLAIDFTCDGKAIQTRDNRCYLWLKNNANIHGLTNLKSEPWHWSINGS